MLFTGVNSYSRIPGCVDRVYLVLSTGVNSHLQLGAGFLVELTVFILCVIYRCKWSGTARGRISGCVDRVYSVCYLQV